MLPRASRGSAGLTWPALVDLWIKLGGAVGGQAVVSARIFFHDAQTGRMPFVVLISSTAKPGGAPVCLSRKQVGGESVGIKTMFRWLAPFGFYPCSPAAPATVGTIRIRPRAHQRNAGFTSIPRRAGLVAGAGIQRHRLTFTCLPPAENG